MALLKKLISSFKKKETKIIEPNLGITKVKEEIKTAIELRKQNIDRQKRLINEIKQTIERHNFNKKYLEYSKILAREILITETVINRLKKETKRPIVVIGNGGTGKPYTWSIKKGKNIYIREINFPSTRNKYTPKLL